MNFYPNYSTQSSPRGHSCVEECKWKLRMYFRYRIDVSKFAVVFALELENNVVLNWISKHCSQLLSLSYSVHFSAYSSS